MQLRDIAMSGYDVWGGEDAGEEVEVFVFMFEDMVV